MLDSVFVLFIVILGVVLLAALLSWAVVLIGCAPRKEDRRKRKLGDSDWIVPAGIFTTVLGMMVLFGVIGLHPYNMKYVTWEKREGVVAVVDANYSDAPKDSVKVVLGDNTVFFTSDIRMAAMREGERVQMLCVPVPAYNNTDKLKCNLQNPAEK